MLARLARSLGRWMYGGKNKYLVGHDLQGNAYYEYPGYNHSGKVPFESIRTRRVVKYQECKNIEDYDQKDLPVQWKMWLRHTRPKAPSLKELQADQQRLTVLQTLIQNIEARDQEMRQREQAKRLQAEQQVDAIDSPTISEQVRPALGAAQDQGRAQDEALSRAPEAAVNTRSRIRSRTPIRGLTLEVTDEEVVESRACRVPVSVTRPAADAQTEEGRKAAGRVVGERRADEDVWQASRMRIQWQDRGIPVDSSRVRRSYSTSARGEWGGSSRNHFAGPLRSRLPGYMPPPTQASAIDDGTSSQRDGSGPGRDIPGPVYAAGAAAVGLSLVAVWTMPDPWRLKRDSATGIAADRWTPLKLLASKTAVSGDGTRGDGRHKLLTLALPRSQADQGSSPQDLAIYSLSVKQPDLQIERSYTPLSSPTQALSQGQFDLVVKLYENGEMARYLHSLVAGRDAVEVRGWLPTWKAGCVETGTKLDEVVLIVGGTGIAPAHQLLSSCFGSQATVPEECAPKFKLLYAAASPDSLLLLPELRALRDRAQNRLDVHLWVDSDDARGQTADWGGWRRFLHALGGGRSSSATTIQGFPATVGRCISVSDLRGLLDASAGSKRAILVCGPEGMVEAVAGLRRLGVDGLDGRPVDADATPAPPPLGGVLRQIAGVQREQVFRL